MADRRARMGARTAVSLIEDAPDIRDRVAALAASAERPDDALERRELTRLVQVALDTLPGRYGDVLEWKYIDGASVAEIAARLGSSDKAVESMLSRARRAFREVYAALCEGVPATAE
jgi:RNA polymerase sigma-70 factor (ECF subfamily)